MGDDHVKLNGYGHLFLETHDFAGMVRFWSALGFETAEAWGTEAEGHQGCVLKCGDSVVVVGSVGPKEPVQAPTMHFSVKSVDQLAAALKGNRAVDVVTAPEATHWNTRWIRVKDPQGNVYAVESDR